MRGLRASSFLTKQLIIPLHRSIELFRHRFAVDGNHGSAGIPLTQFLFQTLLQLLHLVKKLRTHQIPLRFCAMPAKFRSHRPSTIANLSDAIAKFGIFQHFFDIPQLIRPL